MTQPKPTQRLVRLKRQLKARSIGYAMVAAEAGVRETHVCNVLAGRDKSQRVVEAIRRLLEKREVPQDSPLAESAQASA